MSALSPRQQKCMIFLKAYVRDNGISPNYREIATAIGTTSTSQVTYAVDALVYAGLIRRSAGRANSIELLPTEDHHAPTCVCPACAQVRYFRALELVHALKVAPPRGLIHKLAGLKPVSKLTAVYWRSGFPRSEARSQPRMKAVQ